jgi:uncharacterized protein YndB with AHSA1/START domain
VTSPRLDVIAPRDEPVILFRRAFQAPARLVFSAWTEPAHLRHWRVPRGFELVVCEVDLRVGGGYHFVHRAPDGSQHAFRGQYRQIERPSLLVSTFTYEAAPKTEVLDEVTFTGHGGTTLVTGRTVFPTFAARELYAAAGAERGLAECHERLDELVAALMALAAQPPEGQRQCGS